MNTNPMYVPEIAARMGVSTETFYKNRERYRVIDGMPERISRVGRMAWERNGMEAWLTRNDPRRPRGMVAANDSIAPPMPNSDAEWNKFLHNHYAPSTAPA
jgi:hypothetical protein